MNLASRPCRAAFLCAALIALGAAAAHAQGVSWLSDYNAARREAHDKNRPLILDFSTANCHWCRLLESTTFRDPAVVKLLSEHFVAVHLDGDRDAGLAQRLNIQAYPTMVFADPDGHVLSRQDGYVKPAEFAPQLERVLASLSPPDSSVKLAAQTTASGADDAGPSTDRAHCAGQLLSLAQADYREQRYLGCLERCKALKADYADLPEAAEAIRLETQIRTNPDAMRLACDNLTDRLGDMYLDLADAFLHKDQPARAVLCLEWVVQACPGTPQAEAAKGRLAQIKNPAAPQPDH